MPHLPPDELRSGILEVLPDGFGFLREPSCSFLPGSEDIYVSPSQIRKFDLRDGDRVTGRVRPPKESERYHALIRLERVNDDDPTRRRRDLARLTAVHPDRLVPMNTDDFGLRLLELFAPLGSGSRGLVLAPPRSGASTLLRRLAAALPEDRPVQMVLVDTRPEELTEARGAGPVVLASTFDEPAARHLQVAELAVERARRQAETGAHPVVLLDGLDRFDRAAESPHRVRRLFGAGRCLAEGGSLTLLATSTPRARCAEDLRGAATLIWTLDAGLARIRSYPAVALADCWSTTTTTVNPGVQHLRRSFTGDPTHDLEQATSVLDKLDKVASAGN